VLAATPYLNGVGAKSGKTEVVLKEIEPFAYVSLRHKGPLSAIPDVINDLISTAQARYVSPRGALIGIFHTILGPDDPEDKEMEWEVGFPIGEQSYSQAGEGTETKLELREWKHRLVASATYSGPYQDMGETITDIFQWMEAEGYDKAGPVLATFMETGTPDAPPPDIKGEIWIPCKK
jgi:effector-binding domain-containing protein